MLKDIPICQDLLKIICDMVSDKTFVRLTSLSKEMEKYKQIIPLKKMYKSSLLIKSNFKYLIDKVEYIKSSVKEFPSNLAIIKLHCFSDVPKKFPESVKSLTLLQCHDYPPLPDNLIRLEADNYKNITTLPANLLYFSYEYKLYYGIKTILPKFPETLQYLKLVNSIDGPMYGYCLNYEKNFFPKNLRILIFREFCLYNPNNIDIELPETLETVYLCMVIDERKKIKKLPPNVTKLFIGKQNPFEDIDNGKLRYIALGYDFKPNLLTRFPDSIEEIDLSNFDENIKYIYQAILPKSLKKIYINKRAPRRTYCEGVIIEKGWHKISRYFDPFCEREYLYFSRGGDIS